MSRKSPLYHLEPLLKKNPKYIEMLFIRSFQTLNDGVNDGLEKSINELLGIKSSKKLIEAVQNIIRNYLYEGYEKLAHIDRNVFPKNFRDKTLRNLMGKILLKHKEEWKNQVIINQVGLPKLLNTKWRIGLTSASHLVSSMHNPTIVVELDIQNPSEKHGIVSPVQTKHLEMDKDTLNIMLKGLTKIRSQLSTIK